MEQQQPLIHSQHHALAYWWGTTAYTSDVVLVFFFPLCSCPRASREWLDTISHQVTILPAKYHAVETSIGSARCVLVVTITGAKVSRAQCGMLSLAPAFLRSGELSTLALPDSDKSRAQT